MGMNLQELLGSRQMTESMDEEKLKFLMQLRSAGVHDTRVLAAMEAIPREAFVTRTFRHKAYEDTALPIACGQTISQPSLVALMCQYLQPNDRLRVLEIGTGCGYQAAVMSRIFRMVYTIERHASLLKEAEAVFAALKLKNINTLYGDGLLGWPHAAPFERIIGTAAAPDVPSTLLDQLSDQNGVMVLPVGPESQSQTLIRITRTEQGYQEEELLPVRFVPMLPEKV